MARPAARDARGTLALWGHALLAGSRFSRKRIFDSGNLGWREAPPEPAGGKIPFARRHYSATVLPHEASPAFRNLPGTGDGDGTFRASRTARCATHGWRRCLLARCAGTAVLEATPGGRTVSPEGVGVFATVTPRDSSRLHDFVGPRKEGDRVFEFPWHKTAAYMLAGGMPMNKVAAALGRTPNSISLLMREKWFQQAITEAMSEHGGKDVMDMIKGEALASLSVLLSLRDDVTVKPQVRATIASDILDRAFGKPTQRVETVGVPKADDPVAEVERLERENNRLASSVSIAAGHEPGTLLSAMGAAVPPLS